MRSAKTPTNNNSNNQSTRNKTKTKTKQQQQHNNNNKEMKATENQQTSNKKQFSYFQIIYPYYICSDSKVDNNRDLICPL